MRYPFQVIKEWQIPLTPLPKTYPATAAFLELMVTLDELFDEFPAVLRLPEGTALTLLYRDVVYSDQDILNSVGGLACHISETCSLTFYGTTEHRETAEMTVRPGSSPKKGRVLTRSLSGRPIRRLQGLGVRLDLGDRDAADHLTVMARALAASGGPWGVVSRQHEAFVHKCGLLQPTQGSLFSYFAWENARPQQLLTALTAEHKALLWESFLADGQQPLEFAWLWEIYYTDQTRWLLEWELALDMVLDQLSSCTAVVCYNDEVAVKLEKALLSRGIRVPQDVSVLGFDNLALSEMITPALTTVDQCTREIGAKASELLTKSFADPAAPLETVRFKPKLVERESVARRP